MGQRLIGLIDDGVKLTASDAIVGSVSSTYGPYPTPTWRQLDGGEGTVTTTYDPLTDIETVRFVMFNTFVAIDQVRFLTDAFRCRT